MTKIKLKKHLTNTILSKNNLVITLTFNYKLYLAEINDISTIVDIQLLGFIRKNLICRNKYKRRNNDLEVIVIDNKK